MKARKLSIRELGKIIREEVEAAGTDEVDLGGGTPNEEANKTDEVEASEYADTLEQEIDHMKAYKIKEARALAIAKKARAYQKALAESIKNKKTARAQARLVAENKKLKALIRRARAASKLKKEGKQAPAKAAKKVAKKAPAKK